MRVIRCPEDQWHFEIGSEFGVFLAGGISGCPDWRQEIIDKLTDTDLALINPRRESWPFAEPAQFEVEKEQVHWEAAHLTRATSVLFWFPKESICPITMYELGDWAWRPKDIFVGIEPGYVKDTNLRIQLGIKRPSLEVTSTLDCLVAQVRDWEAKKKRELSQEIQKT